MFSILFTMKFNVKKTPYFICSERCKNLFILKNLIIHKWFLVLIVANKFHLFQIHIFLCNYDIKVFLNTLLLQHEQAIVN